MEDKTYFFHNIITKSLEIENSDERIFKGIVSVEVPDKDGEILVIDDMHEALLTWLNRGGPISDTHSNRIVGQGLQVEKFMIEAEDGNKYPAIMMKGKIFRNKGKDYELDRMIWEKIKSGEYKGLSFGGATTSAREPVNAPDGTLAYRIKDLEGYEVAVCKEPANQMALFVDINHVAKSISENRGCDKNPKMVCTKMSCYIDKAEDPDKHKELPIEKEPKELEKQDKEEVKNIIENEHKLLGEKPDKKEQEIHDKLIDDAYAPGKDKPLEEKKSTTGNSMAIEGGIRHNYSNESLSSDTDTVQISGKKQVKELEKIAKTIKLNTILVKILS